MSECPVASGILKTVRDYLVPAFQGAYVGEWPERGAQECTHCRAAQTMKITQN